MLYIIIQEEKSLVDEKRQLISCMLDIGTEMVKSGAEISRVEDTLIRIGLSSPTLKSDYKNNLSPNLTNDFTIKANECLNTMYSSNPEKYLNLKLISLENPDLFNQVILDALLN